MRVRLAIAARPRRRLDRHPALAAEAPAAAGAHGRAQARDRHQHALPDAGEDAAALQPPGGRV